MGRDQPKNPDNSVAKAGICNTFNSKHFLMSVLYGISSVHLQMIVRESNIKEKGGYADELFVSHSSEGSECLFIYFIFVIASCIKTK